MKYLLPFFKKYRLHSIFAPLFKMLEATFDLFVPLVVADIINVGITEGDTTYILLRFGILLLLAILGILSSFTAQFFAAKAATGTASGLRHELLSHIQKLDFAALDKIGSSTLITRMTADINQVQNGLNLFLRLFLRSPFIVFGAMIMAFTIDFNTALIFVGVIPVLFVIVFGIMFITKPLYKRQQARLDDVTTSVKENLTGVRVIRAFAREESENKAFKAVSDALCRIQLTVGKISALMNPLTYVTVNIGIILILWVGAQRVDYGTLLSGDVIALVNYLSQILVELVKLANLIVVLSKSVVSMGRIGQVLDTVPSMSYGGEESDARAEIAVRFDNVSLRYPGAAADSISDISLEVKRGETVGIIGPTGSGKTALISLIARFYDATSGSVTLFGRDIKEWSSSALKKRVTVVMQKSAFLSGTVRSNLLMGKKDASELDMWNALRLAQAEDFVKERGGLDSSIEQGAGNLSGGQRQRLSIARALIAEPEILILDDSSSALDYATDLALRRGLKTLPEKTTVFIVSQRAGTLMHCDKIFVLDDGMLTASGTHSELMASSELYREIYESTSGREGE